MAVLDAVTLTTPSWHARACSVPCACAPDCASRARHRRSAACHCSSSGTTVAALPPAAATTAGLVAGLRGASASAGQRSSHASASARTICSRTSAGFTADAHSRLKPVSDARTPCQAPKSRLSQTVVSRHGHYVLGRGCFGRLSSAEPLVPLLLVRSRTWSTKTGEQCVRGERVHTRRADVRRS